MPRNSTGRSNFAAFFLIQPIHPILPCGRCPKPNLPIQPDADILGSDRPQVCGDIQLIADPLQTVAQNLAYHGAARRGYNVKTISHIPQGHVVFLEPEDINHRFAADASFDQKMLVIPFTGAYLPSSEKLFSPVATGQIVIDANNKWWQYRFFQELNIPTPKTWCVNDVAQLTDQVKTLLGIYDKLLIKKAELSGGSHR